MYGFILKKRTRQILDWKKYNASDFELKKLQCLGFWIEKIATRYILNWNFFDRSDFEKLLAIKNHVVVHFTRRKRHILLFLCLFKCMILNWKIHYVSDFELKKKTLQTLDWKKYDASDFELKKIRRVRFWIETKRGVWFWIKIFSSRQILKKKLLQRLRLSKKIIFFNFKV